jgi:hypothetical protein
LRLSRVRDEQRDQWRHDTSTLRASIEFIADQIAIAAPERCLTLGAVFACARPTSCWQNGRLCLSRNAFLDNERDRLSEAPLHLDNLLQLIERKFGVAPPCGYLGKPSEKNGLPAI